MVQNSALDVLKMGHNVYLTGQAGSGKTFVLNAYIRYLKERGVGVGVTASTGIAATHMNGTTIHSFCSIGIKDFLSEYDLDAMEQKRDIWKRFENTSVLIIDEVSMLHAHRLDMVDTVCRRIKRNTKPFGGMQVVLSGDFFQLPPITRGEERGSMVYHSHAWKEMNLKICYLEEQFRQFDSRFTAILNEIRANDISEDSFNALKERFNAGFPKHIRPTRLFSHNIDVDAVNVSELEKISGESHIYEMKSHGNHRLTEGLVKSCLAPERLVLKIGAQVMFVKNNYEKGYVNGTRGVVDDFDTDIARSPIVKLSNGRRISVMPTVWVVEEDGKVKAEISQVPLRLAWAITVHKSQGMSMDSAEMDLSKVFVRGQGYVALSRVRSLEGLSLLGLNDLALQVDPMALKADRRLFVLSKETEQFLASLNKEEKEKHQTQFVLCSGGFLNPIKVKEDFDFEQDAPKEPRVSTLEKTRLLLAQKKTLKEIAKERGLKENTIIQHIELILLENPDFDISYLRPKNKKEIKRMEIAFDAFLKADTDKLTPVREFLAKSGQKFSFDELKFARIFLKKGK